jgi:hypothetical protein
MTGDKSACRVEGSDLVLASFAGHFSAEEAAAALREVKRRAADLDRVFLIVDMAGVTGVDPNARRAAAEEMTDFPLAGTAIIGASFQLKIVIHFIAGVGRLLHRQNRPYTFSADEAEARAWIDRVRRPSRAP